MIPAEGRVPRRNLLLQGRRVVNRILLSMPEDGGP